MVAALRSHYPWIRSSPGSTSRFCERKSRQVSWVRSHLRWKNDKRQQVWIFHPVVQSRLPHKIWCTPVVESGDNKHSLLTKFQVGSSFSNQLQKPCTLLSLSLQRLQLQKYECSARPVRTPPAATDTVPLEPVFIVHVVAPDTAHIVNRGEQGRLRLE